MAAQQKMNYRLLNISVNQQVDQQAKAYYFISRTHTHTHPTQSIKPQPHLNLHFFQQPILFHFTNILHCWEKDKENVNINLLTFSSLICCLAQLKADYFFVYQEMSPGSFSKLTAFEKTNHASKCVGSKVQRLTL